MTSHQLSTNTFAAFIAVAICLRVAAIVWETLAFFPPSVAWENLQWVMIVIVGALSYLAIRRTARWPLWVLVAVCVVALFASVPEVFRLETVTDSSAAITHRYETMMQRADFATVGSDVIVLLGACWMLVRARGSTGVGGAARKR